MKANTDQALSKWIAELLGKSPKEQGKIQKFFQTLAQGDTSKDPVNLFCNVIPVDILTNTVIEKEQPWLTPILREAKDIFNSILFNKKSTPSIPERISSLIPETMLFDKEGKLPEELQTLCGKENLAKIDLYIIQRIFIQNIWQWAIVTPVSMEKRTEITNWGKYTLRSMSKEEPKKSDFCVAVNKGFLNYKVIDPNGLVQTGEIALNTFDITLEKISDVRTVFPTILQITSKIGHTRLEITPMEEEKVMQALNATNTFFLLHANSCTPASKLLQKTLEKIKDEISQNKNPELVQTLNFLKKEITNTLMEASRGRGMSAITKDSLKNFETDFQDIINDKLTYYEIILRNVKKSPPTIETLDTIKNLLDTEIETYASNESLCTEFTKVQKRINKAVMLQDMFDRVKDNTSERDGKSTSNTISTDKRIAILSQFIDEMLKKDSELQEKSELQNNIAIQALTTETKNNNILSAIQTHNEERQKKTNIFLEKRTEEQEFKNAPQNRIEREKELKRTNKDNTQKIKQLRSEIEALTKIIDTPRKVNADRATEIKQLQIDIQSLTETIDQLAKSFKGKLPPTADTKGLFVTFFNARNQSIIDDFCALIDMQMKKENSHMELCNTISKTFEKKSETLSSWNGIRTKHNDSWKSPAQLASFYTAVLDLISNIKIDFYSPKEDTSFLETSRSITSVAQLKTQIEILQKENAHMELCNTISKTFEEKSETLRSWNEIRKKYNDSWKSPAQLAIFYTAVLDLISNIKIDFQSTKKDTHLLETSPSDILVAQLKKQIEILQAENQKKLEPNGHSSVTLDTKKQTL